MDPTCCSPSGSAHEHNIGWSFRWWKEEEEQEARRVIASFHSGICLNSSYNSCSFRWFRCESALGILRLDILGLVMLFATAGSVAWCTPL